MTPSRSIPTPSFRTDGVVIGIDPGLARTGIGVIHRDGNTCRCLEHRVVRTAPGSPLAERLAHLAREVRAACARHQPVGAAIERTFVNDNPASSLALGQARGAALAVLGEAGLEVNEIAPTALKRRLTGDAQASKQEVARMVRARLALDPGVRLAADASDALALALCCAPAVMGTGLRLRRGRRRR